MSEMDFSDTEVWGEAGEDGRPANIPEKFWSKEGDNATVDWAGLTKEYNYRTSQIGAADGMFGAPEAYTMPQVEVPEGVDYTLSEDDPLLQSFQTLAKESNLSDKAYGQFTQWFINEKIAEQQASLEAVNAELDTLGPNGKGKEMVAAFMQQATNMVADLPEDQRNELIQGAKDAVNSAASYKFLDFLQKQMQPSRLPGNDDLGAPGKTMEEINAMQLETYTEGPLAGRRKYEVDPQFRAKVNALRSQVAGSS